MPGENFSSVRDRCLPALEEYLAGFLAEKSRQGLEWNAEMARYQFSTGGKRLRALIPCWVYAACGADPLAAVPLGAAIEMIHNATLVHDDLQDGDTMRRGLPTVWMKYSSPQAINCGDSMYQFGIELLLGMPLEPRMLCALTRRLLGAVTEVIEGQAQEFLLKDLEFPTVAQYLRVAQGKTAALFSAAFVLALEALGKAPEFRAQVGRASQCLGVLFQIQDDLLDIYGEKAREKRATDIAEGKISFLVTQLLEDATPADGRRALAILRKPREETAEPEIVEVLDLFERYGTRQVALNRITEMRAEIRSLSWRLQEPGVHQLLMGIGDLFLEPIRHLEPEYLTM